MTRTKTSILISSSMNKLNDFRSGKYQFGTAMIEFALVFPLLILLLFGFIEFGRLLYQQNEMTKALATGARFIARSPLALTADCLPGGAWTQIKAEAIELVVYGDGHNGQPRIAGLDDAGAVDFTSKSNSVAGQTACVIQAEASTEFANTFSGIFLPFMGAESVSVNALNEERYIGN